MKWSGKGNLFIGAMFIGGISTLTPCKLPAMRPSDLSVEEQQRCNKTTLLSNFPKEVVLNTLTKYNIPEEKRPNIVKSLEIKDKEIFKIIEQKAASMNPNPLTDPGERQNIPKLIRAVVLEVFTNVLKENGIDDGSQVQAMLDDIQQERVKKFAKCLKE